MSKITDEAINQQLRKIGQNLIELGDNLQHELEIWARHPAKWRKQTRKGFASRRSLERFTWRWYVTAGNLIWKASDIAANRVDQRFMTIIGSFKKERHHPEFAKAQSFIRLCHHWLKSAPGGFDFERESRLSGLGKLEAKAMKIIGQYLVDLSAQSKNNIASR